MQNTQENTYTKEQYQLIAEFCASYGLEPEQIRFFSGDPQPFFDRDATAVLIHKLTSAVGIEDDIVAPPTLDSIAVKYRITFEDGTFASSTGVANLGERLNGELMTPEQIQSMATSRASRGALRNKGIDLVKLHYQSQGDVVQFSGPAKSQYESLLREAHALGRETGLINDAIEVDPKRHWYATLRTRYGVQGSNHLNVDQLADFVAFLRSLRPAAANAAA